jgi:hypothetical protein
LNREARALRRKQAPERISTLTQVVNELLTLNLAEDAVLDDLLQFGEHVHGIGEKQRLKAPPDFLLQVNLSDRSNVDPTKPLKGGHAIAGPGSTELVEEFLLLFRCQEHLGTQ